MIDYIVSKKPISLMQLSLLEKSFLLNQVISFNGDEYGDGGLYTKIRV